MIIKLDKIVKEKTWNKDIVIVQFYNTETHEFSVMDFITGKKFKHATALNCDHLSFVEEKDSNDDVIKYLIDLGIKKLSNIPSEYGELINPTKDKMKLISSNLKEIKNTELELRDGRYYNESNKLIISTISLLCDCLISIEGGCNWPNIKMLQDEGYKVYAGEKDSFGWLTGCVEIDKEHIIIYG